MPRTSKCESYCFFQAYTPYLWSGVFCVISFHLIFGHAYLKKNVGGKSCCSSLECSLASEFSNQNFTKMWSIHPCHVWFLWLLQSWFPISYSKQWYIFFFQNIWGNTRRSKYFYPLTHNYFFIFFFWLLPHFFHKIFVGGLVFGDDFLVLIWDGVIWGVGPTTGMVSDEGDLEKMTTKAKNASLCTTAQLV